MIITYKGVRYTSHQTSFVIILCNYQFLCLKSTYSNKYMPLKSVETDLELLIKSGNKLMLAMSPTYWMSIKFYGDLLYIPITASLLSNLQ